MLTCYSIKFLFYFCFTWFINILLVFFHPIYIYLFRNRFSLSIHTHTQAYELKLNYIELSSYALFISYDITILACECCCVLNHGYAVTTIHHLFCLVWISQIE